MQWYESARGRERLNMEVELVRSAHPGFDLIDKPDGRLAWVGDIGPSPDLLYAYTVSLTYPSSYPVSGAPKVEVLEPTIRSGAPHRFTDGSLCIEHDDFDAAEHFITDLIGWTCQWLALYERWANGGSSW